MMKFDELKIRITGSGGQGIITAGIILADSFFLKEYKVLQTQTYGAAVRGSSAICDIIISSNEIYEFTLDEFNFLLVMNKPSFIIYHPKLEKSGGILLLKSL